MIHASMELLSAMRGDMMRGWANVACNGAAARTFGDAVYATLGPGNHEDRRAVACGACLLKMRAATPAVRWDYLAERGLVSLEAK